MSGTIGACYREIGNGFPGEKEFIDEQRNGRQGQRARQGSRWRPCGGREAQERRQGGSTIGKGEEQRRAGSRQGQGTREGQLSPGKACAQVWKARAQRRFSSSP